MQSADRIIAGARRKEASRPFPPSEERTRQHLLFHRTEAAKSLGGVWIAGVSLGAPAGAHYYPPVSHGSTAQDGAADDVVPATAARRGSRSREIPITQASARV